ncbi:hypothetical protein Pmar_PMAR010721 [Perkinsus marinus ATCC 50983]|uniref:Uncharacterized protein n=1 Tax=Perkinsus marinus (strain ATCC 50983 / TXsc) TaxID=423536 RepID=C5L0F5_PERM5|nr:hypothetical protein Pmar_PMAR010721 [Perkinsus marinus ATCC 50983]EER09778.1 hypothetical protein Pmar_PMAR010721 [Perkinsus marinus ATCC 50983]|eukprot:XP_002777983.1 hypothetical protein Pmar_PMAR010721 [Perkinsus marinus ATCC 50983]
MEFGRWSSEAVNKYLKGVTLKNSPLYAKTMTKYVNLSMGHSTETGSAATTAANALRAEETL